MTLKKSLACFLVGSVLVAMACTAATEGVGGNTNCQEGERFYNGQCLRSCTRHEDCSEGAKCLAIDQGSGSICVRPESTPGGECTFLGSDTKCVGLDYPGSRFSRGGKYTSDPLDANDWGLTPYDDPYFRDTNSYRLDSNPYCKGDAVWTVEPATTNPGCGQRRAVQRCRATDWGRCGLVDGTTLDRPNL